MAQLRPDKDKYRKAWNKSWEDDLLDRYPPGQKPPNMFSTMSPQSIHFLKAAESLPSVQLEKDVRTKEICLLQRDLAQAAVTGLSNDNLEERWRSLSQQRREELVLEGLYVTACVPNGMENWRLWCPEMTVAGLSGTNDRDFIHLLKMLLPIDQLKETLGPPLLLSNPTFEELIMTNDPVLRRTVDRFRLNRSYFITMAVWSIFNAFYGNRERIQVGKPLYRDNSKANKDVLRQARELYKTEGELFKFSEIQNDYLRRKEAVTHESLCCHCNRKEADVSAEREHFQVCSRCKVVGRVVRYCSVECQKKDWKHGFPRPHKAICGKDVIDEEKPNGSIPETKDTELESGIPPPDPSFKRSPDLLHQISFITKPIPHDYVYMQPRPFDDIGIDIPDIEAKVFFTFMRRRAMISGDPIAVLSMYAYLKIFAPPSISEDQLKEQLRKEYGVDIKLLGEDYWGKEIYPPSEEEQRIVKELVRKKLMHRNTENEHPWEKEMDPPSEEERRIVKELVRKKPMHRNVENEHPPTDTIKELVGKAPIHQNVENEHLPIKELVRKERMYRNVENEHPLQPPTGIISYLLVTFLIIFLVPYLLSVLIH